jgi:hypothetical protein
MVRKTKHNYRADVIHAVPAYRGFGAGARLDYAKAMPLYKGIRKGIRLLK